MYNPGAIMAPGFKKKYNEKYYYSFCNAYGIN